MALGARAGPSRACGMGLSVSTARLAQRASPGALPRARGAARGVRVLAARSDAPPPQAPTARGVVAVTGATGFVGSALVPRLLAEGYGVRVLCRDVRKAEAKLPGRVAFCADGTPCRVEFVGPADAWDVSGCVAVVNLAGKPIIDRWSEAVKKELVASRVGATERVAGAINAAGGRRRPKVLVSASAVGYYGVSDTAEFDETSSAGGDFLAGLCEQWEAAANEADTRTVNLRIGIVLDKGGGALGSMAPAFELFTGGPLGRGTQPVSWVHRDDLVSLILAAIEDERYAGPVNATAPEPTTMAGLSSALGGALMRPSWIPVPEAPLQAVLGEGATVLLDGQRALPSKARELGFEFKYDTVEDALNATFPNSVRDAIAGVLA